MITDREAIELIAHGGHKELVAWINNNVIGEDRLKNVLRRGYVPKIRDGFEYRGAIVWAYKEIARRVLRDGPKS